MSRKVVFQLALFAVLIIATQLPAFAGAVYVPIEVYHPDDETIIWVTNPSGLRVDVFYFHIPTLADGTARAGDPQKRGIAPGKTLTIRGLRGPGMMEVYSEADLEVTARVIRNGTPLNVALGSTVPIITSTNSARADETLHVEGMQRGPGGEPKTDFRIVNLGHLATTCTARFNRVDGPATGPVFVLGNLAPLSLHRYTDVLGVIEEFSASGVRIQVSCDESFYIYSVVRSEQTEQSVFTGPRPSTVSALLPPGLSLPCSTGATCYEHAGVFHTPRPGNRVKRLAFPLAPGQYNRIRLRMEVRVGPWSTPSSGLHNIFWLALDRNRDLYGYVNFRGPNNNDVLFRHGVDQVQEDKARITVPATINPGGTYVINYIYDTNVNLIELLVTNRSGQEVARVLHTPNVNRIQVGSGQQFLMDFGFLGINPNEPPTFDWDYQNLFIEFVP